MLEPPDPVPHHPACASNCDLPLLYVVSTGEYECDDGHSGHLCTCDEIHMAAIMRHAEAIADDPQAGAWRAWGQGTRGEEPC